ncbi:type II secretion system F family protein [Demequina sp. NBRC 110053]|uniref:type II secretion system F family protein n=1 Tax=Demequina sp. NBRC 110053 TaxID=1570342 RepID=UPI0009FD9146|nr:hypothetical protein [Demequina sp. NBRC 110053]
MSLSGAHARGPDAVLADAVALLHAGVGPERAWEIVGVTTAGDGVPVQGASDLADDAMVERSVIAAATLARNTGAPLARVLEAIDAALAQVRDAQDAAEAALAGPRMSARILRWLPLVGAGLAAAVDSSVVSLLVGTSAGWALLVGAAALTWAGSAWMARMVRAAGGGPSANEVPTSVILALLDAALASGMPVDQASERVAEVAESRGARQLREMAAWLRSGAERSPAEGVRATGAVGGSDSGRESAGLAGGTRPPRRRRRARRTRRAPGDGPAELMEVLAGPLSLALHAGAPARFGLRSARARLEREQRRRTQRAAGELGVRLTLPLALCLLPSFVLVGVVPLLIAVIAGADLGSIDGIDPDAP